MTVMQLDCVTFGTCLMFGFTQFSESKKKEYKTFFTHILKVKLVSFSFFFCLSLAEWISK